MKSSVFSLLIMAMSSTALCQSSFETLTKLELPSEVMESSDSTTGSDQTAEIELALDQLLTNKEDEAQILLKQLSPAQKTQTLKNIPFGFRTLQVIPNEPLQEANPEDPHVTDGPISLFEQLIDDADFLPAAFLELAVQRQKAVGRIAYRGRGVLTAGWGTGFFISKDLIMTNNHVLPTQDFCSRYEFQINYQFKPDGNLESIKRFAFNSDSFFYTNEELDFTIVRVTGRDVSSEAWDEIGFVPLFNDPAYWKGQPVNVIQHPAGRAKEVVLHNSYLKEVSDTKVAYTADTEGGSSGSPVFDNSWNLIALHNAALTGGKANQGIRIDKIREKIRAEKLTVQNEIGL